MFSWLVALQFLTTLPVPIKRSATEREINRSLRYFPLVGAVLGVLLVAIYKILSLWLAPGVVALLCVIALVMLTGAIHLDGFLDSCDGLIGWQTTERRLEIMRDSRVGSFGVGGGWALLSLKYVALAQIAPDLMPQALLLAPILSRWAMAAAVVIFPYGRTSGYGSPYKKYSNKLDFTLATLTTLLLGGLVMRGPALVLTGAVFLLVLLAGRWVMRKLPSGLTGDTYGAITELSEAFIWLVIQASAGIIKIWL